MIIGVDFGAPKWARDQRRKIIAVAAQAVAPRVYRVGAEGMNARLFAEEGPGWSARELSAELTERRARAVGFDFPFCVPRELLLDPRFGGAVGHAGGAFGGWVAFNRWVAECLPLTEPLDFAPFAPWRAPAERAQLWGKRATDWAANAQPPLKDKFQSTFQMTLLGNALLAALRVSGHYRVLPFESELAGGDLIEVYPRRSLRRWGLTRYKAQPAASVWLARAACAAAGIQLEIDPRISERCCTYNSGTGARPDYDAADAFVALVTTILYAEGACTSAIPPHAQPPVAAPQPDDGAIWAPVERA